MAVEAVTKIAIIGPKDTYQNVLESLQLFGHVQIDRVDEATTRLHTEHDGDYDLAQIEFAIRYLEKFPALTKPSLLKSLTEPYTVVTTNEVALTSKEFDYKTVVDQIVNLEEAITVAKNKIDDIRKQQKELEQWVAIPFAPGTAATDTTTPLIVLINSKNTPTLEEKLLRLPVSIQTLTENIAVIYCHQSALKEVQGILQQRNIVIADLKHYTKSPAALLAEATTQTTNLGQQLSELQAQGQEFRTFLPQLQTIHDILLWKKIKQQAADRLAITDYTFVLNGWIPSSRYNQLHTALSELHRNIVLLKKEMDANDQPPIILKNNKLFEPFEQITGVFGSPKYAEPDPSAYLAPFFTLFFGFALTDAGYGIVMAVLCALVLKLKIFPASRKLVWVLFWGGVSSFILGVIFGGWFSVDLAILPDAIRIPLQQLQLINPLESPLTVFYLALGLGVLQVMSGLLIDFIWKLRHNQQYEAVTHSGAWLVILTGIILMSAGSVIPFAFTASIGKWMAIAGVAVIVLGKAKGVKNPLTRIGSGLLGLYGIVGYFSDVLSYSRLLALGLTTGIIGSVVNIIAGLALAIPYVGWIFALIVLIGGHTFNIIINALGAYIHSGRLQFIEFFNKFLEGGGSPFAPLERKSKYIQIVDNR